MGQYYLIVNIDKKEYIEPDLLKLMETSYIGNPYPETVVDLLAGRWKGDRVMWCGDYAQNEPHFKEFMKGIDLDKLEEDIIKQGHFDIKSIKANFGSVKDYIKEAFNYYFLAEYAFTKIEPNYSPNSVVERPGACVEFILNEDKKEAVAVPFYRHAHLDYTIHPLPLLTATSNGRGGGDYEGINMEYVGSWAGDRLSAIINDFSDSKDNKYIKLLDENYQILDIHFQETY